MYLNVVSFGMTFCLLISFLGIHSLDFFSKTRHGFRCSCGVVDNSQLFWEKSSSGKKTGSISKIHFGQQ